MKNWLIKKLGGFTYEELNKSKIMAEKAAARNSYKHGFENGVKSEQSKKTKSYSWLKSEIHRKLDILFPGKEFDRARFRWLKQNTMTSSHISEMHYDELVSTNDLLGDI